MFIIKCFTDSKHDDSLEISSGSRGRKTILFKVVSVEVDNNFLVDNSLKRFADDTKTAEGAIV